MWKLVIEPQILCQNVPNCALNLIHILAVILPDLLTIGAREEVDFGFGQLVETLNKFMPLVLSPSVIFTPKTSLEPLTVLRIVIS